MSAQPWNAIREWKTHPAAEELLQGVLEEALRRSPEAADFRDRLLAGTAVRLRDILDHVTFADPALGPDLERHGWQPLGGGVYRHDGGMFPDFVSGDHLAVAFRVDSVAAFLAAQKIDAEIEGKPLAPLRRARVFAGDKVVFQVIERNGHPGHDLPAVDDGQIRAAHLHLQTFRARRREFSSIAAGFDQTEALVDAAVADLGPHWTCALFGQADREYWMLHCAAGRFQKARQDALGIGWSNLDHVAYDASRPWFEQTIRILEKLGYECRELFYAGDAAGWGSQILEQPVLRSTIFADIDLAPEELDMDFAHMPLPPLPRHRRAGMWCAMHGESLLEGGINHVAGLYDQRLLREHMTAAGFVMMEPFSSFDYLYQELTTGEWRAVDPVVIDALEAEGHMSATEAENFRLHGAIGNHLENMERNQGYKGFNQPGIDDVLRKIDPRRNMAGA